jgi:glycosyltransferase involved in cell wall biosynthesis
VRVLNYLELEARLDRSGIGTSVDHQRQALADTDVELLTSPWHDGHPGWALGGKLAFDDPVFREYDVAHCNMIGPGSVAVARHAIREDIPLVLHSHVTREDFRDSFRGSNLVAPALGEYLKWFYSQADLVLCPSEYTKGVLESYPVDALIRPITNGVDTDALTGFEDTREEYRDRYELDGMVVFAVGNVFERKGLTTFCELAQATDYDFAWFGPYDDGPQASKTVKRWTADPPENVTFTGWIDDIRGAYGAGDVYLFPTKNENQGIAVLEAMACGKAVVLSDIPVFREYYEDGHDCLICSDEAEFREALERLEANPELRERLGENAMETAREHSIDRRGDNARVCQHGPDGGTGRRERQRRTGYRGSDYRRQPGCAVGPLRNPRRFVRGFDDGAFGIGRPHPGGGFGGRYRHNSNNNGEHPQLRRR